MVFVNDKKYACETCIKGHRSSTCNHTDRPLFEIKKKGRPATQCEHCRELRKTKQVHIKCVCEGREDAERQIVSYSIPAKKANRKGLPASAAFPHGLTELVGASASSEEVVERKTGIPCTCTAGGECHCFSPRRAAKARAASDGALPNIVQSFSEDERNNTSTASGSSTPHMAYTQNGQDDSMMFSEESMPQINTAGYDNNQFDVNNQGYIGYDQNIYDSRGNAGRYENAVASPTNPLSGSMQSSPLELYPSDNTTEWIPSEDISSTLQSLCECGDHCHCPGCLQHGDPSSLGQYMTPADTCVNPNNCVGCLSCIFLNPTTPFVEGALTTLEQGQSQSYDSSESVDDWLRQVIAETPLTYPPTMTGSSANVPLSMTLTEQELWEIFNNSSSINTNATPFLTQSSSSSSIVSQYDQLNNIQESNYENSFGRASDGIDFSFHAPTPISSNQLLPNVTATPGNTNQSQNNLSLNVPSNSSVSRSPSSGSQSSGRSTSGTSRVSKPRPIVHIRPIAPNGPLPLNRPRPLSPVPQYGHRSSSPRSAGSSTAGRLSMTSASASSSASVRSTASVSPDSAAVHEFRNMNM